jgi:hypothetical protein
MVIITDKIFYDDFNCMNMENSLKDKSIFRTCTLLTSLKEEGYITYDYHSEYAGSFFLTEKGYRFFGVRKKSKISRILNRVVGRVVN